MTNTFWNGFLRLLFPPICLRCRLPLSQDDKPLCPACRDKIVFNHPPFCPRCSRHRDDSSPHPLCPECRRHPYAFDHAWGACTYNDTMKDLLHLYKYKGKTSLRFVFIELMASFIERYEVPVHAFDLLAPIPLHPAKLRERQYNQSLFLAQGLSKRFGVPVIPPSAFVRERQTRTQALLNEKERWTNIQGAFKIRQPSRIKEAMILIVDDLMTTGATASHAAALFKDAGAHGVSVLTLALA